MKSLIALYTMSMLVFFLGVLPAHSETGQLVKYQSGEETVEAYLATPSGPGPFPAIVVFHEWWGLNDWIKQNVDLLAERGYVAIAIDLYRGHMAKTPEDAGSLMRSIPNQRAIQDMKAVTAYLKTLTDVIPNRLGAIGWSMGGGYALTMALTITDLDACIVNYGRLINEKDSLERITCPILGIFGEDDRGIPVLSIRAFKQASTEIGKSVDIIMYPGVAAAFMNENDKRAYNVNASKDAWDRIFSFLNQTLYN
jgi:carboxymethylenebutenolidase